MIALYDGVEIGYDDVGVGMPVAFVHGFPHNRTLWAPQVGALVDRARCIAPDLRGFGESSKHGPFTIDQFADDLAMLLRELGIERAVIVGLSMGGYIALNYALKYRQRILRLTLAHTRARIIRIDYHLNPVDNSPASKPQRGGPATCHWHRRPGNVCSHLA